jgi:hypothetical protein
MRSIEQGRSNSSFDWALDAPDLSAEVVDPLYRCIKFAPTDRAEEIAALIGTVQVQNARLVH